MHIHGWHIPQAAGPLYANGLNTLTIRVEGEVPSQTVALDIHAPNLQHLNISYFPPQLHVRFPSVRLTSLTLAMNVSSLSSIYDIESLTSKLDTLRFDLGYGGLWDTLAPDFSETTPHNWLALPSLPELRIHGEFDWQDQLSFTAFLDSFESFVTRSQCSIEILRLDDEADVVPKTSTGHHHGLVSLFQKLTVNKSTPMFLPQLKVLELQLSLSDPDQELVDAFLEMVELRAPLSDDFAQRDSSQAFLEEITLELDLEGDTKALERVVRLRALRIELNIDV
ncbi:hypothetical protein C8J56DRAFT_1056153 [Mycena floridula]|nr:hypothetical protein C8J56DRAFT_1056153 [Mycena floridula]